MAVKLDLTSCLQIIHKVAHLSLDNQDLSIAYPDEAASSFRAFASTLASTRKAFPHIICVVNSVASCKPLFRYQLLSEAFLDHITFPGCTLPIPFLAYFLLITHFTSMLCILVTCWFSFFTGRNAL